MRLAILFGLAYLIRCRPLSGRQTKPDQKVLILEEGANREAARKLSFPSGLSVTAACAEFPWFSFRLRNSPGPKLAEVSDC
jgi:hypothetical protein